MFFAEPIKMSLFVAPFIYLAAWNIHGIHQDYQRFVFEQKAPAEYFVEIDDKSENAKIYSEHNALCFPDSIEGIKIFDSKTSKKTYKILSLKNLGTLRYPYDASQQRKEEINQVAALEGKVEALERGLHLAKNYAANGVSVSCSNNHRTIDCEVYLFKEGMPE